MTRLIWASLYAFFFSVAVMTLAIAKFCDARARP